MLFTFIFLWTIWKRVQIPWGPADPELKTPDLANPSILHLNVQVPTQLKLVLPYQYAADLSNFPFK